MLEAKNLELAGCYYQEPMSYPALLSWCEAQAAELWPYIVDTGAYLEEALKEGKRVVLEAQLELCGILIMAFFHIHQVLQRFLPTVR